MTEKIIIDKSIINKLVDKSNIEHTGDVTNDYNLTNPAWVDGYKEGMSQAINAIMVPIYLSNNTQPTFKVEEYYSYKSMENLLYILKITAVRGDEVDFTFLNTESGKSVNMDNVKLDKRYIDPATAEQIATFKRAEQFAKHGRKLDEFKQGDQVQNIDAGAYGVVDSLYDGDVVLQYHKKGPLYKSVPECLTLIQTAEELQEEEI